MYMSLRSNINVENQVAKTTTRNRALCLLLSGVCILSITSPAYAALDKAAQAGFVPHKALYEIKMKTKKSSAKVSNIHGKMMYEWQPACDAWISNHHFDMTYEYYEGPPVRITSDFSNHESFDGKSFNYTTTRKTRDMIMGEVRGSVKGDIQNEGGKAVYTKPETLEYQLPEGTLFPMAHTLGVLEKIKAGKKFYNATIFDGSDEEGPVTVNSFIGKSESFSIPEAYKDDIDADLVSAKSWNIRLAFFPLNKYEVTSDYEMSLLFHENGVISDMVVEYKDFSVVQKLVALEPMDGACETVNEKNDRNP